MDNDKLAALAAKAAVALDAALAAADANIPPSELMKAMDASAVAHDNLAYALVNAYRAGKLMPVSLDADTAGLVERWSKVTRWCSTAQGGVDKQLHDDTVSALRTNTAERDALAKRVGELEAFAEAAFREGWKEGSHGGYFSLENDAWKDSNTRATLKGSDHG